MTHPEVVQGGVERGRGGLEDTGSPGDLEELRLNVGQRLNLILMTARPHPIASATSSSGVARSSPAGSPSATSLPPPEVLAAAWRLVNEMKEENSLFNCVKAIKMKTAVLGGRKGK